MPKIRMMKMRMQLNPEMKNEADLELYDDIGEEYDSITQFLRENQGVDTINVHINSNGGFVFEGITIHNVLKGSGKTINVIIDGLAASIASVIAMAGDTVKMYPTSQMMIHNCWTYCQGNANELRKIADQMDGIMESSKIAYLSKAKEKLPKETLDELLDEETYLTAQMCYDYGLCDEIIGVDPKQKAQKTEPQAKLDNQPNMPPAQKTNGWFF